MNRGETDGNFFVLYACLSGGCGGHQERPPGARYAQFLVSNPGCRSIRDQLAVSNLAREKSKRTSQKPQRFIIIQPASLTQVCRKSNPVGWNPRSPSTTRCLLILISTILPKKHLGPYPHLGADIAQFRSYQPTYNGV